MHVFQSIRYLNSSELGIWSNLISISLIYVCTGEHGLVKSLKIRNFSHGLSHSLTYLLQTHNIPNPFFFFKLYCLSDYHMLCALVSAIFLFCFFFCFVFPLLKHISSCHAAAGPLTFITFSFPPTPRLTCMHIHWMLWNIWLALQQYASQPPGQETFQFNFHFFKFNMTSFLFHSHKMCKGPVFTKLP